MSPGTVFAPIGFAQRLLAAPPLGDVMENQHDSDDVALGIAYRRHAVFDADGRTLSTHQRRMIGQFDNRLGFQNLADRMIYDGARILGR